MNGFVEAMIEANCFYDLRPDETRSGNVFQRVFAQDCSAEELVWHRDKKDRTIKVVSGVDWKFQHDNELPFVMKVGDVIKIKKETYHRIHKGEGRLILEIEEND